MPIMDEDSEFAHKWSTLYDSAIEEGILPKGDYLVRFVVRDVFNNTHYSEYIPVSWDGETLSY